MKNFPFHIFSLIRPRLANLFLSTIREHSWGSCTYDFTDGRESVDGWGYVVSARDNRAMTELVKMLNTFGVDACYMPDWWDEDPHNGCLLMPETVAKAFEEWAKTAEYFEVNAEESDIAAGADHAIQTLSATFVPKIIRSVATKLAKIAADDTHQGKEFEAAAFKLAVERIANGLVRHIVF